MNNKTQLINDSLKVIKTVEKKIPEPKLVLLKIHY